MEKTLLLIKPGAIQRGLIGEVIKRIENKGLQIVGLKMFEFSEALLCEHYSHLVTKPFFPDIKTCMQASPVIACCIEGVEAVKVVRDLTGATNGRNAVPGTIRGDFSVSVMENVVHTSDSLESAAVEVPRFFGENELFSYNRGLLHFIYAPDELAK